MAKDRKNKRYTKFTIEKRELFLKDLAEGYSISHASAAAGVTKMTAYKHREKDPDFAKAWEEAIESGTDVLEDEAKRRAAHGTDEPVFHRGEIVGHIRKYSDTLLIFMLKARRPQKYRDTYKTDTEEKVSENLKSLLSSIAVGPVETKKDDEPSVN